MTDLIDLTMLQALEGLAKKSFSAQELTARYIAASQKGQPQTNAYITETYAQAEQAAKASDARRAAGQVGAMEGLPLAMKDLFCTKNIRTTAASKILDNFIPPYESTVSQKLLDAGTITLGKANLDEFAMGSINITSGYGPVISPWSGAEPAKATRKLHAGGSSGGSAAAVAARMALGATGTDTGGSIRYPAAISGIVGVKPTYGRCSRYGIIAYASSLDQAGCLTRTVGDAALMLRSMVGYDPKDSTSMNIAVPDYLASLGKSVKGLKIGIPREYRLEGMPQETEKLWDNTAAMLQSLGAQIVNIALPHTKYALPTYYILAPAEASSNLARYDGVRYGLRVTGESLNAMYENTRAAGFGAEAKRRIMMGTYVLSEGYYDAYYLKAQKVRRLIRQDFLDAFHQCDAILTPPTTSTAFGIDEKTDDPIQIYLTDIFTVTLNLAGLPGLVLPVALCSDGLPMGMQLIGKAFDEETLFTLGDALEKEVGFTAKPPFTA
ncbi:MAG: Asp-tRNA(Asn)/Glu-tRNA(Gln) amidotransferase subunit GatA [Alphaproteobacteria bacterium]|nr:Asp-tRNA(Asn)/Glu-tRNA(Gln) amidotransferase subunit GatA [Alphaproteobacteria bacterium]